MCKCTNVLIDSAIFIGSLIFDLRFFYPMSDRCNQSKIINLKSKINRHFKENVLLLFSFSFFS